eukprot:Tbor_TRINITY_DN5311_c1_g2::TRINITY_DN5311_c1_g2_i1::g.5238::m.5238/K15731/CTDSP; carboxy-terminal domain RNA polymerase II polypeptide A small phosphatase
MSWENENYFRAIAKRIAPSTSNKNNDTTNNINNNNINHVSREYGGVRNETSSLMTQASQNNTNNTNHRPALMTFSRSAIVNDVSVQARLKQIRKEPINASPNDANSVPALLAPQAPHMAGKKVLVLDVDETLVHSSYTNRNHYDLHLPLVVADNQCNVYVAYRPHVHEFLRHVAPLFEIVIFTASVSVYCNPLMNELDRDNILGRQRLFREHCCSINNSHIKDLSLLGRKLSDVVLIDNSPVAYAFQQRNSLPIISWFNDPNDRALLDLLPILNEIARADDVYQVLDPYNAYLQVHQNH